MTCYISSNIYVFAIIPIPSTHIDFNNLNIKNIKQIETQLFTKVLLCILYENHHHI